MDLNSFSANAADLVRLRRALYGPEDAKALMLRCFRRSKSERINERTVFTAWAEQDEALDAALCGEAKETPEQRDAEITRMAGEWMRR